MVCYWPSKYAHHNLPTKIKNWLNILALYNLDIPPEMADRLGSTQPLKISRDIIETHFKAAKEIEKERFDALERVGFRVDREAVLNDWILLRGGGYYIDVGTSARIASGDINVKSGDRIKRFVENGLEFESGQILEADVVVFATGYQRDPRIQAATIVGQEVAKSMRIPRGLDEDGEIDRNMMPVGELTFISCVLLNVLIGIQGRDCGSWVERCPRRVGTRDSLHFRFKQSWWENRFQIVGGK
jgi:hypothetical protein